MFKKSIAVLFSLVLLLFPSIAMAERDPVEISTFTGSGEWGSQNGGRDEARFRLPTYVTMDQHGMIYVADTENHMIRLIDQEGNVTKLAGQIVEYDAYGKPVGGNEDGAFAQAKFNEPRGLSVDAGGNLYVADSLNGSIRKLNTNGQVSTLVSGLHYPSDLVLTSDGELYVTETLQHRLLRISMDGHVTVVAGGDYTYDDGLPIGAYRDGVSAEAQFNEPTGLALAEDGTLYIADTGNQRIRSLSTDGYVRTIAGSGTEIIAETGYYAGGFMDGPGEQARFNYPHGITMGADGSLFVVDTYNHRVRQITSDGNVRTIVGLERHGWYNGSETTAMFNHPTDLLVLPDSNLLIVDQWNQRLRLVEWYKLPTDIKPDGSIHLVWNNEVIPLDTSAENVDGRVMVPVRAIAETLGFDVEWIEETGVVIITQKEQTIILQIGNFEISGDQEFSMDIAPYIKDNRTLVPIRFVAEAFQKQVNWLADSKTILIRD